MLTNQPAVRATLYYATLILAALIIVLKYLPFTWASQMAAAAQDLITYVGGIAGWTAGQNITQSMTTPPAVGIAQVPTKGVQPPPVGK